MRSEEYRLKIADLEHDRIPMSRLAEYLTDLASLLGHRESVHFSRVENGSTEIVAKIDYQDVPKVKNRLRTAAQADAPDEIRKAFRRLDRRLRNDNTSADLLSSGRRVIEFPGNKTPATREFGPFNEPGSLTGIPIRIGGENDPVPVHLRDTDGTIYQCLAKIGLAQGIAKFMFQSPIRVEGTGRWRREASGEWVMEKFTIRDFGPISQEDLSDAIARLRGTEAPWSDSDDPIRELQELRDG